MKESDKIDEMLSDKNILDSETIEKAGEIHDLVSDEQKKRILSIIEQRTDSVQGNNNTKEETVQVISYRRKNNMKLIAAIAACLCVITGTLFLKPQDKDNINTGNDKVEITTVYETEPVYESTAETSAEEKNSVTFTDTKHGVLHNSFTEDTSECYTVNINTENINTENDKAETTTVYETEPVYESTAETSAEQKIPITFIGTKYNVWYNGFIEDNGEYYTVNFLKNEEFQNRINADIREVSDELYKYDDTPETKSPIMPQYRKNSKGLDLYPYICNGYMYLRFFYNHEYNHAATLVYDIIEEKRIEKIEELFTDTSALYEDLNRVMREKSGTHDYTYTAEITPENITGFDFYDLFINDGSEKPVVYPWFIANCFEGGTSEYCKMDTERDMRNCIKDEFIPACEAGGD